MANVIQLKRGNEAQRTGFTPAAGEPIFILDENKMYIGDGSTAAQSLSALGGDLTMANGSNNRVMTATSSSGMNGEANLTFDGSTLAVTGDATVSDDLGLVSDDAQLTFGANSEVKLIHKHNEGLLLKHTATADDKPVALILQTGETDIAADDVLGKLSFQAPDEGTGTDAILVAAEIAAVSEGDFSSSSNATSLHFRTGSSAAAADRLILTSAGHLTPAADGTQDLGTSSLEFKDGYFDGTLYADAINFNGTAVSATAAELNIMDGVTATTAELNIMDGVTSTAAELNILDGVTSTAAELNVLDGITAVVGELNLLDMGSTANGTAVASKALVLDSNKDTSGMRNVTISGELDAATLDISGDMDLEGDADVNGTLTTGALVVEGNTTVQNILAGTTANTIQFEGSTDDTNETTLGVIDPTGDRTINLPNVSGTIPVLAAASTTQISSTPAELNILDGATVVVGEINMLDLGSTAVGSAVASKVVTYDSNKDFTGGRNITISGELDAATLDISGNMDLEGNIDVNGTSNLDVVDIDGAVDCDGAWSQGATLTVGVDDTGHDVKFFGATSGAYMLWDESADDLILAGAARVVVPASGLVIGSTAVTSTAAELNIMDGVTATTAELNIMDGVTSTAAELNILDGVTSTAAELNVLDGITAVVGELNALDLGSTAVGNAIASKAVVLDSNKDYTGIRNFTITGALDGATISGGTF